MKRRVAASLAATLTSIVLLGAPLATPAMAATSEPPVCPTISSQSTSKNNASVRLTLVSGSQTSQSLRVRTTWHADQDCVQFQWATDSNFTKNVGTLEFNSPIKKESVPKDFNRVIQNLDDNEKYYIRGRVINYDGVPSAWSSVVTGVTKARTPHLISASAKTVANGKFKISWKNDPEFTTRYRIHLAQTPFASGKKGKNHLIINVPVSERSYTVSAADLKKIGAAVGSGRVFRYRVEAQNQGDDHTAVRFTTNSAVGLAGQPNGETSGKTTVRVASFNVVSSRAEGNPPSWGKRKAEVAKAIVKSKAGIVGLQEASTNKAGSTTQVKQLLSEVKSAQKKANKNVSWKLVRSTRYIKPGQPGGDDGARILFDSKKYKLVTKCSDTTGKGKKKLDYSTSCTVKLPRIGSVNYQRSAQIAQFQDRKTKQKFWVVSAHLEHRKGKTYDRNRIKQAETIMNHVNKVNKKNLPVFFVGDLNSSSQRESDYALFDKINAAGYYDASTANKRTGLNYDTFNRWASQKKVATGVGARIDFIYVKSGDTYAKQYTNVKNGAKASDHNLIYADIAIK